MRTFALIVVGIGLLVCGIAGLIGLSVAAAGCV